MHKGIFITIEGGEGSGKSSLISSLSKWLLSSGLPCVVTREPGGTLLGEKIRNIFLSAGSMGGLTELMLILAARAEHVSTVVEPALKRGDIVLCDRYVDSTMAYQAFGRRGDVEKVWHLATEIIPLLPDLTLYLDVPPEVGFKRVYTRQQEKRDRLESEEHSFHERVREGFLSMAARCPERVVTLDALKDEEDIAAEAKYIISKRFDFPCM
jgi:dTMP kinase